MPLAIDVVSDVVCPWCYIGKRRLEAALALWEQAHPGEAPTVVWHPFELNPTMALLPETVQSNLIAEPQAPRPRR